MDVKNKKLLIGIILLIVLILIIACLIAHFKKEEPEDEKVKVPETFIISYSFGGGFGTYVDSITRKISVDQDGNVKIELDIKDSLVEPLEYKVEKKEAQAVMEYFVDNEFYNLKKDLAQENVYDASSSYLEVKSDSFNRRCGGYAAFIDKKYSKFTREFNKLIDEEKLKEFNAKVKEAYEKER